jgi:hypothetical protein
MKKNFRGRGLILRGKYTEQLHICKDGEILGDIMTVEEYLQTIECGGFIDYDGHGHPVKDNMEDANLFIHPSQGDQHIPFDATHIVWFNK